MKPSFQARLVHQDSLIQSCGLTQRTQQDQHGFRLFRSTKLTVTNTVQRQEAKRKATSSDTAIHQGLCFSSAGELSGHLEPGHPGVQSEV